MDGGVDYDSNADAYRQARTHAADAVQEWRAALTLHLAGAPPGPVLDLGAGTGAWTRHLRETSERDVVAVEPSAGMVGAADRTSAAWVRAKAEELPFRAGVFAAAWLATVIHHFDDLDAAARELRRVVEPGGRVLVRSVFPGRLDDIVLFEFFPEAAEVVAASYPSLEDAITAFARAGFADVVSVTRLRQVLAPDVAPLVEYARRRADTTLVPLDDAAIERGVARVEAAVAAGAGPLVTRLDLLVLA